MHSFIFNSKSRIPSAPYKRIWILSIFLLSVFLCLTEVFWRSEGYYPSIVDNEIFWSFKRDDVYAKDGIKRFVIIGDSRAQLGIDPSIIDQNFPNYKTIQLAIDGTSGYCVLKNLLFDSNFNGIIIYCLTIASLQPENIHNAKPYVEFYKNKFHSLAMIENKINSIMQIELQNDFVIFSPHLNLSKIILSGFSPKRSYLHLKKNRFRPAFYSRLSEKDLYKQQLLRLQLAEDRTHLTSQNDYNFIDTKFKKEIFPFYKEFKKRGGELFLLRMPTTGKHFELDIERFPIEQYWDKIIKESKIPSIFFKDYPSLSGFKCPDYSHLDATDSTLFTKNLTEIIKPFIDVN